MAEILIKATNSFHSDPDMDARGSYKRGMPVIVMPDGHEWGAKERLPNFIVLKIPGISVTAVQKYVSVHTEVQMVNSELQDVTVTRRLWRIRWADLPLAARNKLQADGELIIKTGTYDGPFDYTWTQIKTFFRNQATNTDETEEV